MQQEGTLRYALGAQWNPGKPVAAFDFDSTLHYYRRRGFPDELTKDFLVSLSATGTNIVIFSNRSSTKESALSAIKDYINDMEARGVFCDVFAATSRDRYRKPQVGAWEFFVKTRYGCAGMSMSLKARSFFCGDAAGREGDFSPADRWFAHNAGLKFFTPEQVFGTELPWDPIPPLKPELQELADMFARVPPKLSDNSTDALTDNTANVASSTYAGVLDALSNYEAILMMGSPASGKSTFAKQIHEKYGHVIICLDEFGGRRSKHYKDALHTVLCPGTSNKTVVDETSGKLSVRTENLETMVMSGAKTAIVWLKTAPSVCNHLDGLRCHKTGAKQLPTIAFAVYRKYLMPLEPNEANVVFELEFEPSLHDEAYPCSSNGPMLFC